MIEKNIHIYNHCANANHIIIEGRLYRHKEFTQANISDSRLFNLFRKLKHFYHDEHKNTTLFIMIKGATYRTQSDDEGYFKADFTLKAPLKQGLEPITLHIQNEDKIKTIHTPVITEPAIGIISDFDDTVVISDVTNKFRLLKNLFLKNYKQREHIVGMKERFEDILSQNPKDTPAPLFFVTGSPHQLYTSIEQFLDFHDFPSRIVITKKIHGDATDPLLDQFKYKVAEIETFFTLYPDMRWVLFGDSGEKDEAVYRHLQEKYPQKVQNFFIRDVKNGKIIAH